MLAAVTGVQLAQHGGGDVGGFVGVHDVAGGGGSQNEGVALAAAVFFQEGVEVGHYGGVAAGALAVQLLGGGFAVLRHLRLLLPERALAGGGLRGAQARALLLVAGGGARQLGGQRVGVGLQGRRHGRQLALRRLHRLRFLRQLYGVDVGELGGGVAGGEYN